MPNTLFKVILFICLFVGTLVTKVSAQIEEEDTLIINTFNKELQDINSREVTKSFFLPTVDYPCKRIILYYKLECPNGGCDPWDRTANIEVIHKNQSGEEEAFEIGRFISPYGIGCRWKIDISDYRPILTDTVKLKIFMDTWVGNGRGWLVSVDFGFVEGIPEFEPYSVQKLWKGAPEYGNPDNPIDSFFKARNVLIDAQGEAAVVRTTITGHGQGNTENAAEFSQKTHTFYAGNGIFSMPVWRNDCNQNPCSPQMGTWQYPRAGWCPGDVVKPKRLDVTTNLQFGQTQSFLFEADIYENLCRPGFSPCPCPDCNYNGGSHTMPILMFESHLILFKKNQVNSIAKPISDKKYAQLSILGVSQDKQLQLQSLKTAHYTLADLTGRTLHTYHLQGGTQTLNLDSLPTGAYLIIANYPDGSFETKRFWLP